MSTPSPLQHVKREHRRIERKRTEWVRPETYHAARRKNLQAVRSINRLAQWLASKGWELKLGTRVRNIVDFNDNIVYIATRSGPQAQLAFLAHECGHIVVDARRREGDRFSRGWPMEHAPKRQKNMIHRVSLTEEEIEAWAAGERLLKRLNIKYDQNTFLVCKTGALRTYFRWAGKRKPRASVSG